MSAVETDEARRRRSLPEVTAWVDVDGDGRDELLLEYPAGARGTGLKVFRWDAFEFEEIADLWSESPGFEVRDIDNDGRIEIVAHEIDPETDLPNAAAPRVGFVHRWNNPRKEFQVVDMI